MANEYLQRTPTSTGNRKVWTLAGWVKLQKSNFDGYLFNAYSNDNNRTPLALNGARIQYRNIISGSTDSIETKSLYRDSGSWLHFIISTDTTQSDDPVERVKIYINGKLLSEDFNTTPNTSRNSDTFVNASGIVQRVFDAISTELKAQAFDWFLVDGQALTPDVFGFYKQGKGYISVGSTQATDFRPGQWVPKTPRVIKTEINRRGGFGVNGFYLPMNDSKNFGADFHGDPNSIITLNEKLPQPRVGVATTATAGIGFTDALRADPYAANLVLALPFVSGGLESGRGDYSHIIRNSGAAKTFIWNNGSVTPSIGNTGVYYGSGGNFPGSTVGISTSTDFKMDGSFTVESWFFSNNLNSTNGNHIVQYRDGPTGGDNWLLSQGSTGGASIRFLLRNDNGTNAADLDVTNTGITTNQWYHFAGVYDHPNRRATVYLNGVAVGINTNVSWTRNNGTTLLIGSNSNGPTGAAGDRNINGYLQDLRVYKGVAKYTGGFDVPKPYTPVGIATFRAVPDTCLNNFATWNPLSNSNAANAAGGFTNTISYSNGNNTVTWSGTHNGATFATVGFNTGQWYWEGRIGTVGGSHPFIGISSQVGISSCTSIGNNGIAAAGAGPWYGNGGLSAGDVIGIAVGFTNAGIGSTFRVFKNGTEVTGQASYYTSQKFNNEANTWVPSVSAVSSVWDFNFGQNPTFSGNTTAGTFTDSNGKGLFKYEPPSGFLALCEDNLPTPVIADPGKHFKTVLYAGDTQTGRSITGIGFTPDLVWMKVRNDAQHGRIYDSVRGATIRLIPSLTQVDTVKNDELISFNADGFSLGNNTDINGSGYNYVAWCWRAGAGTTSTNTNGSITSVVSVNQDAGFSIVSWTGNGSNGETLGHGLAKRPKMIISKRRDTSQSWYVWTDMTTQSVVNNGLTLNTTGDAAQFSFGHFTSLNESTLTLTLGASGITNVNTSGATYIAYCWAEIEGFNKFGSYVGNGNADGPFVYCGFKPAWVMIKMSSSTGNWCIHDSSRGPVNVMNEQLQANLSNVESGSGGLIDFLSNGFKIRTTSTDLNTSTGTHIFAAYAESPFQTANAK